MVYYLDLENGNDANNGTTWALAWKTFTNGATAARIAPGDEIRVAKSADPTSIGNATWTSRSGTVTLASAQTATIDNAETAWTAANTASVTRVISTTVNVKQGTYVASIVTPATTNTATKYAYRNLGVTLDLSSYQQITFWFRNETSAVADANRYTIKLCSDTTGDTSVDEFAIPAIPSTARWVPITLARNGGGNLGNAIKSIALYTGSSSPGNSQTIYLDNFSACTTGGLNLRSLISKNSGATWTATDGWWNLQYIDGTDLRLSNDTNTTVASTTNIYYTDGTSPETVTTYIRPALYVSTMASTLGNTNETIQDSGTAGNLITFSGGWNTSNTTQDGMTFIEGANGLAYYFTISQSYIKMTNFGFARVGRAFTQSGTLSNLTLENFYVTAANNNMFTTSHTNSNISNILGTGNLGGLSINSGILNTVNNIYVISSSGLNANVSYSNLTNLYILNSTGTNACNFSGEASNYQNITIKYGTNGITGTFSNSKLSNIVINNTTVALLENGISNVYSKITAANNTTLIGSGTSNGQGSRIYNLTESGTTTFLGAFSNSSIQPRNIAIDYINGSANDSRYYTNSFTQSGTTVGYSVLQQTTTVHTPGGVAPQFNILNTNITSAAPAYFPIARIAVNANTLVTIKCWVKKSHATDIGASIAVKAYEIVGVTADQTAIKANDTNWEQLTITFTPSAKGVVNVYGQAWWITNAATQSVYFDDVQISQA